MTTINIRLDSDLANTFLNECIFTGPNAEAVRSAMVEALRRSAEDDEIISAMGLAITELAWSAANARGALDLTGISEPSMVFIREALRPANKPTR